MFNIVSVVWAAGQPRMSSKQTRQGEKFLFLDQFEAPGKSGEIGKEWETRKKMTPENCYFFRLETLKGGQQREEKKVMQLGYMCTLEKETFELRENRGGQFSTFPSFLILFASPSISCSISIFRPFGTT